MRNMYAARRALCDDDHHHHHNHYEQLGKEQEEEKESRGAKRLMTAMLSEIGLSITLAVRTTRLVRTRCNTAALACIIIYTGTALPII